MTRSSRRALTAAEILIASLAAALLSVPLLVLMFQERDTEQRARYEYLALVAARDDMYEARFLVTAGATAKSVEHPFQPLDGSLLRRLDKLAAKVKSDLKYHPVQHRLETKISVEPGKEPRLARATVLSRWQNAADDRPNGVKLVTGLLSPPVAVTP